MLHNLGEQLSPPERQQRAVRRRGVAEAAGAMAGIFLYDDFGGADAIVDTFAFVDMAPDVEAALREAFQSFERSGERPWPARPHTLARRTARAAPMWHFEAARSIVGGLTFAYFAIQMSALMGDEEAVGWLERLEGDLVGQMFRVSTFGVPASNPVQFSKLMLNVAFDETALQLGWAYARALTPVAAAAQARLFGPLIGEDNDLVDVFRRWGDAGDDLLPVELPFRPVDT